MHWLSISPRRLLDLTADGTLLRSMGALARWLDAGNQVAGERGLFRVLGHVAANEDALEDVLDLLKHLQTVDDGIEGNWRRLLSTLEGRVPDDYRILGCSFSDLEAGRCGGGRKRIGWSPIDRELDRPLTDLADLSIDLGAAASQDLIAEVGPSLPDEIPRAGARSLLRIGLRGAARASAAVSIPIRIGNIGTGAASDAGIALDYYLSPDGNDLVADALADGMTRLTTPFDLDALSEALSGGSLLGVTSDARGALELGGSFGVGQPIGLAQGIAGEIGFSARFKTRREGRFRFSIQGAGDDSNPRAVLVDIARIEGKTETDALALGLRLDLGAVREQLPRLLKLTDDAQRTLEKFDSLLPPSRTVAEPLRKELERKLGGDDLERRLAEALGVPIGSGDTGFTELIQEHLGLQLDGADGLWEGPASALAQTIIERVGDGLGVKSSDRDVLVAAIEDPLLDAIDRLQFEFRQTTRGLARGADTPASLKAELQGAQRVLSKVSGAIRQSAEVKLQARLHREERRSHSRGLQMRLRFHPEKEGAGDLFARLMTGSLDEALVAADEQAMDGPVEVLGSVAARAAGIERKSGFEVALLDLPLSRTSFLDADVAIETDQAGNIQVYSRTEDGIERRGFGEVRTLRMVNVFELATADITGRMTFAISLSHREEHFDDDEVLSIFRALEQEGLLPFETGKSALKRLDEHTAKDPDAKHHGELRVWLELDGDELLRLLQLEPEGDVFRVGRFDSDPVYRTAVAAIVSGHERTGSGTVMNNLEQYIRTEKLGTDLGSVLLDLRNRSRRAGRGFGDDSDVLGKLERMSDNANGLAEALKEMRAIYLSTTDAARRTWTEQDYLKSQTLIDEKMQAWMRGEFLDRGILRSFSSNALRPYTLAYFKTIATLARGPGDGPPLAASLYFDAEPFGRDMPLI